MYYVFIRKVPIKIEYLKSWRGVWKLSSTSNILKKLLQFSPRVDQDASFKQKITISIKFLLLSHFNIIKG